VWVLMAKKGKKKRGKASNHLRRLKDGRIMRKEARNVCNENT